MAWENSNRSDRLPSNWRFIRAHVLKRDGHQCQIRGTGCTFAATEVDHIEAGDNHRTANLRAVCSTCHAAKSGQEGAAASAVTRRRMAADSKRPPERHPGLI